MKEHIEFETVTIVDPATNRKKDAVSVIRNGHRVALLPEADRLRRALNLSLEDIKHTVNHFQELMDRPPNKDEQEFWKAVLEYKRGQEHS